MSQAISIEHLHKVYDGGFEALKDLTLHIEEGDFFGLLGPNGAGKSTTIGILSSLVQKTSGTVKIFGEDIDTAIPSPRRFLGIVPQEFNFNIFESCLQIVTNQAGYYGVPYSEAKKRALGLFEQLGLTEKTHASAGTLSGGMKRRLLIARALIHSPRLLILDEPTAGVDISLRRQLWQFLGEQNKKGLTVILTTHYLEEAEHLCEHIAIIDQGKLIENTSKQNLLKKMHSETLVLYTDHLTGAPSIPSANLRLSDDGNLEATIHEGISVSDLIHQLNKQGITVHRIKNKSSRLEELFVQMVEMG